MTFNNQSIIPAGLKGVHKLSKLMRRSPNSCYFPCAKNGGVVTPKSSVKFPIFVYKANLENLFGKVHCLNRKFCTHFQLYYNFNHRMFLIKNKNVPYFRSGQSFHWRTDSSRQPLQTRAECKLPVDSRHGGANPNRHLHRLAQFNFQPKSSWIF